MFRIEIIDLVFYETWLLLKHLSNTHLWHKGQCILKLEW